MEEEYYVQLKEKAIKAEIFDKVRDYEKAINRVNVYFEMGEIISKAGRKYGKNIINNYSAKLMIEVGKKYNYRTLYRMRKFYEVFSNKKLTTMLSKLSWSHYCELLSLKDTNEIIYYINECQKKNLTQRELHELIKNNSYNRLSDETKNKLIESDELEVKEFIPNPIIIKTESIKEKLTEYALKEMILVNIDAFLNQLGLGYTYVGNEYKIKMGDRYNYIDLLLFNYECNSFVVVELKVTELKKEYIGQIEVYMNYIDNNLRSINHNKTIGLIICKENDNYVIKYCSDKSIIFRKYSIVNINKMG